MSSGGMVFGDKGVGVGVVVGVRCGAVVAIRFGMGEG